MFKKFLFLALVAFSITSSALKAEHLNPCWMKTQLMHKITQATTAQGVEDLVDLIDSKYGPDCEALEAYYKKLDDAYVAKQAEKAALALENDGELSNTQIFAGVVAAWFTVVVIAHLYDTYIATHEEPAEGASERNAQEVEVAIVTE